LRILHIVQSARHQEPRRQRHSRRLHRLIGVRGSEAQARSLGFEPGVVYVPHPIQDRTDDEMRALADQAFDQALALIKRL